MNKIDTNLIEREINDVLYGLERQTSEILTKIATYMDYQRAFTSPLVINLWGPTGTGKSQMVRMLVQKLGLKKTFFSLNASNSSSSTWGETLKEIAEKLGSDYTPEVDDDELTLGDLILGSSTHNLFESSTDDKPSRRHGLKWPIELSGDLDPVVLFIDEFQNARALDQNHNELLRGDINEIWGLLDEGVQFLTGVYHPTIIFTAGNIELSDAEEVEHWKGAFEEDEGGHYMPLGYIQQALSRRFRPEMIARLRTNHYYFGPITRDVARKIANRELHQFNDALFEAFDIHTLSWCTTFIDELLDEFNLKGMGARGVESIINQKITSRLHEWILSVKQAGQDPAHILSFDITGNRKQVTVTIEIEDGDTHEIRYSIAEPNPRPKTINHDQLAIQAIHEAGHAVSSYLLMGIAPSLIKIGIRSGQHAGFVDLRPEQNYITKQVLFENLVIKLAGFMAERIHFGRENMSAGATSDLNSAIDVADHYIHQFGFGATLLRRTIGGAGIFGPTSFEANEEDRKEVIALMESAGGLAESLLKSQSNLVKAIARASYLRGSMTGPEILDVVRYWIDRSALQRLREEGLIKISTHAGLEIDDDAIPQRFDYMGCLFGDEAEDVKPFAMTLGENPETPSSASESLAEELDTQSAYRRLMFPLQGVA